MQWEQIGEGEYVCGLEPANCSMFGRADSRKAGNSRL